MDRRKVIPLHKNGDAPLETDMCRSCHMQIARFAPQVLSPEGTYHRECYESWHFAQYGRRPSLLPGVNGDRHRFQVRERAAAA